jgi:precorrin-6B methylase 2
MRPSLYRLFDLLHGTWFVLVVLVLSRAAISADKAGSPPVKKEPLKTKTDAPAATAGGVYEFRTKHDPNGIGKFYMGREIAHVMGFIAADWLERPEREDEEKLTTLVAALDLKPGQVVADVGAGSGVISFLIADEVGPEGKVLCVDVQQKMLDLITRKIREGKIENVDTVLGTPKSPGLKAGTVDLILMVDVYHEFEFPYEMLRELSAALKPGGRIAFVEYRLEDPEVPIKLVHKMTEVQVKREAGLPELGLRWKETIGDLPRQHLILFEKAAATP